MILRSQKTFVLILFFAVVFIGIGILLNYLEIADKNLWLALVFVAALFPVLVYYFRLYRVFGKIIQSVEALLAGAKYKKIFLLRNDEFGLLAQFFNQVTKNLENVSFELKEGNRRESELSLAAEIQRSVLPKAVPLVDKLDIAARTRPADEVGGDSFGIMQKGLETYFYLGDVTGHGAPAGLIMMMVNTLLYVYLDQVNNTKDWLVKTNRTLKPRVNSTMFMTTVCLRWQSTTEKMFYTGAGHEHILIYRASEGVCEAIPSGGIALGMADDISEIAQERELVLHKEDIVILYTDGIPEARNAAGEMYTLNRLKKSVETNGSIADAQKLFESLAKDLRNFVGEEPQLDDITLIVMRYTGVPLGQAKSGLLVSTAWGL